jgi:Bifunctional DNA primase/polymerase, N-terminal
VTALLAAALEYAQHRWPVFPCAVRGKVPAIARGFYAATTNPETIRRHWRIADRNIGIPTGSASGFWVLDVDGNAGEASLRGLEIKHGRLPASREVITGGGGRHLWFKYTGPIQSTTGRIGPGIDTRAAAGYVIVPPSIHPNGRRYEWSVDSIDEPAIAPDWSLNLRARNHRKNATL